MSILRKWQVRSGIRGQHRTDPGNEGMELSHVVPEEIGGAGIGDFPVIVDQAGG